MKKYTLLTFSLLALSLLGLLGCNPNEFEYTKLQFFADSTQYQKALATLFNDYYVKPAWEKELDQNFVQWVQEDNSRHKGSFYGGPYKATFNDGKEYLALTLRKSGSYGYDLDTCYLFFKDASFLNNEPTSSPTIVTKISCKKAQKAKEEVKLPDTFPGFKSIDHQGVELISTLSNKTWKLGKYFPMRYGNIVWSQNLNFRFSKDVQTMSYEASAIVGGSEGYSTPSDVPVRLILQSDQEPTRFLIWLDRPGFMYQMANKASLPILHSDIQKAKKPEEIMDNVEYGPSGNIISWPQFKKSIADNNKYNFVAFHYMILRLVSDTELHVELHEIDDTTSFIEVIYNEAE